jgi:hypothetical protein
MLLSFDTTKMIGTAGTKEKAPQSKNSGSAS